MRALREGRFEVVPGEFYGTPTELWGFRTRKSRAAPKDVARDFIIANRDILGLQPAIQDVRFRRRIESLGATHWIFQQLHLERRVHRAYVTVHVDHDGRVYNVKSRAVPGELLPARLDFRLTRREALRRATLALPHGAAAGARARTQGIPEQMWFPTEARLIPVWRVRLGRRRPVAEDWIVYVNARTGGILSRYDNLSLRSRARAWVFDPNPVIALNGHAELLGTRQRVKRPPRGAYTRVTLRGLSNDREISGRHVTTAPTDSRRRLSRSRIGSFVASHERGFEELMAYYHIDAAVRWLEHLGYHGRRKIFPAAVRVNVNGSRAEQAYYSASDRQVTFGTGSIDSAEDGETILHELGHAIQDAICPDFGQSFEAAAMGEGFGDYLAASFFAERKPKRYRTSVMTWWGLFTGLYYRTDPPCERRVDASLKYRDFKARLDYEHDNGMIWSAALWAIREALGRRTADTVIIESHYQLDGYTTFARGARAIIDADANLNRGRNERSLKGIFKRRGIL